MRDTRTKNNDARPAAVHLNLPGESRQRLTEQPAAVSLQQFQPKRRHAIVHWVWAGQRGGATPKCQYDVEVSDGNTHPTGGLGKA